MFKKGPEGPGLLGRENFRDRGLVEITFLGAHHRTVALLLDVLPHAPEFRRELEQPKNGGFVDFLRRMGKRKEMDGGSRLNFPALLVRPLPFRHNGEKPITLVVAEQLAHMKNFHFSGF